MQVVEKTRSLLSAHLALFGKRAILKVTAFLVEGAVSAKNVITLSWQGRAGPARASALSQQAPEIWPASGAGKRRPRRKARSMEQETAHNEHAEVAVRGHTEAATRKELLCPTRL